MSGTVLRSVKLKRSIAQQVDSLRGEHTLTQVVNRALARWIRREKRLREDEVVVAALRSRSSQRIREVQEIAKQSSRSALRVLKGIRR